MLCPARIPRKKCNTFSLPLDLLFIEGGKYVRKAEAMPGVEGEEGGPL